jgi:hypothetical protein
MNLHALPQVALGDRGTSKSTRWTVCAAVGIFTSTRFSHRARHVAATRTEERALVWGFELTTKAAAPQGVQQKPLLRQNTKTVLLTDLLHFWCQPSPLEQLGLIWNSHRKTCCRWPRGGSRRENSRHRTKHAATRLPPAGPPESRTETYCRRRSN